MDDGRSASRTPIGIPPRFRFDGRRLAVLGPFLGLALLVVASVVLHRELEGHHLRDVLGHLRDTRPASVALASLLAAASYLLLSLFDVLGLRYAGRRIPYPTVLVTAFISYAFGHNIGVATLTGGAIRYRMYSSFGLSTLEVSTVAGFCTLTSAIGLSLLIGGGLLLETARMADALRLGASLAWVAGAAAITLPLGYAAWGVFARKPLEFRGWTIDPPTGRVVLPQLLLGALDVALAASVLWVLLPPSASISIAAFAGIYALASTAGLVSHVPGGVGVFESVMLLALPQAPADELLGALLAYRAIYYLCPLLLAALLFGYRELLLQRERLLRVETIAAAWISPVVPQVAGMLALLAGLVLLVSGATPAVAARLGRLSGWLPLGVLEVSHLAGSVAGLALVILARALFRRSEAAYHLSMGVLCVGIAASILKGLDIEEAALLAALGFVIWLGRRGFYRPASALRDRFSPVWVATVFALVGFTTWIGVLSYRHVDYSNDLWWTFAFDADASRTLRASLLVSLGAAGFLLANLLGQPRPKEHAATTGELGIVREIVGRSPSSLANAALTGDKQLLFDDAGSGFVMYRRAGRAWVSLGDPVCPDSSLAELAWRFHELVDQSGGWTVFYQASAQRLAAYLDIGLTALKIGEEARVPLGDFSLEGSERAGLRHALRRAERDGARFEILPAGQATLLLPELRRLSDEWLARKATGEKGFSIGRFSGEYLDQFPLAVVRVDGRPVAFANVWPGGTGEEFSVDLMRFGDQAPRSAMDYLFIELMLWGKSQGYRWFSLGMAPLAGLVQHPLAPAWNRVGNFVFRHGEHFYNFEGLRRYKEKFLPAWEPRYLLTPGGLAVPRVLAAISVMIAGSARQVLLK